MAFKLGREQRRFRTPKETPIFRKNLDEGILGEANDDGSIYIDKSVKPGSKQEEGIIKHESQHAKDMASGKLAYGDDYVRYNKKTYHRQDGQIKYNGNWLPEGSAEFPWEKRAEKAKKSPLKKTDVFHYSDKHPKGKKKISYDEGVKLTNQQQHIKFTGEDLKKALNDPNIWEFKNLSQDEKTRIINQDERERMEKAIKAKNKKNPPTYNPEPK